MGAGRRRALLIAVPAYPQLAQVPELKDTFPALQFTARDAANLRTTLLRSGYLPENVTVLDDEDATSEGNIREELGRFLNASQDGDAALVYFAGHGVRIDGTDCFVPSDVRARYGENGERTLDPHGLIGIVPDDLLLPLRSSATVMLCFDACRSGGGIPPATFEKVTPTRRRDNVVILSACAPGEEALGHPTAGSVLAKALNEALARESEARTFGQVIRRVIQRTPEIAANYTYRRPPTVIACWLSLDGTGGTHADVELCEAMLSGGFWADAIIRSDLWERTEGTAAQHAKAREQLADVVTRVVSICEKRPDDADPWADEGAPVRLFKRLHDLVDAAGARLSLIETVVLLGAPFLREAALACGLLALHNLDGDGPGDTTPARTLPEGSFTAHLDRDMGDVRRAHRQIEATRRTLLRRGRKSDARSAEYWLRHRFLADWDLLWEDHRVAELESLGRAVDLLVQAAESAVELTLGPDARDELRRAIVQVVSQLGTGTPADAVAPDGREWVTDLCASLCGEADRWSWRPAELATLLHLAGLLAIDPRMLDGVLIDHLGEREPTQVRPESIIEEIAANDGFGRGQDKFRKAGVPSHAVATRWLLVFKCSSAALFTALDRLAARITAESEAIRRSHRALRPGDLLSGLPQVVKTEGLMPRNRGFDNPPPRFRLAEDEVKPLIMGTQLYGDRMLAVRELYQNALDACRVRQARRRYAQHARHTESERERLAGRHVVFTQDIDRDTGRMYIECEDNGVGMTAEELRDLFAQAGRRSEQSSGRMREMRRWRRRGITTELNSRFGIGVFSYFMLAEEVEVTTRPVDLAGHIALPDGHRASVTAGSGLMHLSKEQKELESGGTRVRLYLHDDPEGTAGQRPSLIQTLREFLWCSPVLVTAQEFDGEPVTWRPGDLYGDSTLPNARIEATDGVWWVQGPGMLLADGLFVSEADTPHGYVVNLRGRHRPELSVDRNRFLGYDERAVEEDLKAAVPALIRSAWRPFPLQWLWSLAESRPGLAQEVIGELMAHDMSVSVPVRARRPNWVQSKRAIGLREVGCLPVDDAILKDEIGQADTWVRFFVAWRLHALGVKREVEAVVADAVLPRPEPLDAVLFRRLPAGAWREPLRAAADTGRSLREAIRQLRRYAVTGVRVPEAADIRALDEIVPTGLTASLYEAVQGTNRPESDEAEEVRHHAVRRAMVRVSESHKVSLGTLAQLFEQLSALDRSIPAPPDLKGLASHRVDARERRVLLNDRAEGRFNMTASGPFSALVRPMDVACRAHETGIAPGEIEAVVRRFEPLGYRLAGPDLPGRLDESQLGALSRGLTVEPPFLPLGPIGLRHLVRLAAKRAETVGETASWLDGWVGPLGYEVVDPGGLAPFLPPDWCAGLPAEVPAAYGDAPAAAPVSAWAVLGRLDGLGDPESQQRDIAAVEALADAGLVERTAVEAARAWLSQPWAARPRSLWKGFLTGQSRRIGFMNYGVVSVGPNARLEASSLLGFAADSGLSLAETAKEVRSQVAVYGFDVCEIPEDAAALKPDVILLNALCNRSGRWRKRISLSDLTGFADRSGVDLATAAADLNAYRSLGAPTVPVPPGFVRPSKPVTRDVAAEHALLQPSLDSSWTLTPFALVVAAARLGSGLQQTYRRLQCFALVGLGIPFPEPSCTRTPDWRDVVLLTGRLTGGEPALTGDVSEDHLGLAAEETGLTADEVRTRLQDYAPLFGLRLPPSPSSQLRSSWGDPDERN
ncbi:caspase family protein [Streptomyces actinomycinicus]|uniref:Caspase family protein n=1 Tax=Streptomyces actinomycinicus TaxID=1695166 RepID=A0A937EIY5_9ACTN|nr:caspase family protein [Streptomyces actinomycinicus]MBL1083130.1 caspase family protein [Streptomyces actinomycinicus]